MPVWRNATAVRVGLDGPCNPDSVGLMELKPALLAKILGGLCATLTSASLPAQISMTAHVVTPSPVHATSGPHAFTNTYPVSQLPTGTWAQQAIVPGASAIVSYFAGFSATSAQFRVEHTATVATAPGSATTGPLDILVQFTAPTPTPVHLDVHHAAGVPPGFAMPLASIDVGDDGTIDYVNGVLVSAIPPLVAGPQPVKARIRMLTTVTQVGETTSDLRLDVVRNNNISVTPAVLGCTATTVVIGPSMIHDGLILQRAQILPVAHFVVFGLSLQPVILPTTGAPPCLLLPSPDLAVLLPFGGTFDLDLPPAVRPVTFWVQSVVLLGPDVLTGGGFQIDAF